MKSKYQQEVLQLFRPYVQTKLALKSVYNGSQGSRGSKESVPNSNKQEYSPATIVKYKGSNNKYDNTDLNSVASTFKLREKAVALQK